MVNCVKINKSAFISSIIVLLLLLSTISATISICTVKADNQIWVDDFNYQTTSQMVDAGWEISDPSLVHFNDGQLILMDTTSGYDYNVHFPLSQNDLSHFRVETRATLLESLGSYSKSPMLCIKSNGEEIFWGADYTRSQYILRIEHSTWLFSGFDSELGKSETFAVEFSKGLMFFYHGNQIIYVRYAPTSTDLLGISLSPDWASVGYDYVSVSYVPVESYPPDDIISHSPIVITHDSEFVFENGVTSGSGTELDPFVIENWVIRAPEATGIYIGDTNSYFVIRNCFIIGAFRGISLENAKGKVESNVVVGDEMWNGPIPNNFYAGITLYGDEYSITDNIILNTIVGLEIAGNGNIICNNDFVNQNVSAVVSSESEVIWNVDYSGNYWGDYNGLDENQDGIGDSPYVIDENNQDNFPLMDMRFPDLDEDGIYNDVDQQPLTFSNWFSDYLKGGGITAYVARNYLNFTVKDEPAPYGLGITVHPPEITGIDPYVLYDLWILSEAGNYSIEAGTDMILTHGSEHVKVNEGTLDAEFRIYDGSKIQVTLFGGDEIVFDPSTSAITNNGQNTVIVLAFGEEFIVDPGVQLRFGPYVSFTPETLVFQSYGKWITAHVEPSLNYDATEIDLASLALIANGKAFYPDPNSMISIGDFDNNGILEVTLKFLRDEILAHLGSINYQSMTEIQFTITGSYTDGAAFSCSNAVNVFAPRNSQ